MSGQVFEVKIKLLDLPEIQGAFEKARRKMVAMQTFIQSYAIPYRRFVVPGLGDSPINHVKAQEFDDGLRRLDKTLADTDGWYLPKNLAGGE